MTGRDKLVYPIDTVNGLKRVLRECLDNKPEVDLVYNDLYWIQVLWDFTTHWADLSRKECDKLILGRYIKYRSDMYVYISHICIRQVCIYVSRFFAM